jgi:hypothetical protein
MSGLFNRTTLLLLIFIVFGGLIRFNNLNWGAPFYFHPDERNIASSVTQLRFPGQLNPKFFAYGSLPIYTIYTTGVIKNIIIYCLSSTNHCLPSDMTSLNFLKNSVWQNINTISFENAIVISRIYSAVFSILLILLLYKLGAELHSRKAGIIAAFITTTSIGFIQFAHFGTFEMWQTLFSALLLLICIQIVKNYSAKKIILASITLGLLIGTKVSNLVLLPLLFFSIISVFNSLYASHDNLGERLWLFFECVAQILITLLVTVFIFIITNPYSIFDFISFKNSLQYESGVALGTTSVFYSQEFYHTIPVLFQFQHVYPFLLNPLLTILFIPSLLYVIIIALKTNNRNYLLLTTCYLLLFLSQAVLFVKWTRYMVPTLPFMYLITAIFICSVFFRKTDDRGQNTDSRIYRNPLSIRPFRYLYSVFRSPFSVSIFQIAIFFTCTLFAFSYYQTVLVQPDTRIAAADWVKKNTIANTEVASEVYDLGIIPFNNIYRHITLCNNYDLERNPLPCDNHSLNEELAQSNFVVLPSERILKTRLINSKEYPKGSKFYQALLHNTNVFRMIYKTPCDIYCKILYLGDPLFSFEQTANVFDRPTVYIFKKDNK